MEYEDYDNATDFYHVNEYEYEEEYDERYGPAEREEEFSLNAQVLSLRFSSGVRRSKLGLTVRSPLIRTYRRKGRRENQPFWEW